MWPMGKKWPVVSPLWSKAFPAVHAGRSLALLRQSDGCIPLFKIDVVSGIQMITQNKNVPHVIVLFRKISFQYSGTASLVLL